MQLSLFMERQVGVGDCDLLLELDPSILEKKRKTSIRRTFLSLLMSATHTTHRHTHTHTHTHTLTIHPHTHLMRCSSLLAWCSVVCLCLCVCLCVCVCVCVYVCLCVCVFYPHRLQDEYTRAHTELKRLLSEKQMSQEKLQLLLT